MTWFTFDLNNSAYSFLSILFEGIPFLLLGSIISGFVDVFVSPERMAKILPGRGAGSVFLSGLLGLVFPMCECGSVIVIRRFIRKGLPLSAAITYMLASPIVSPIVAISTYAAFRGSSPVEMTVLRLLLGYALAVGVGLLARTARPEDILAPAMLPQNAARRRSGLIVAAQPLESLQTGQGFAELAASASIPRKLLLAIQSATADFLDVAFFLIIGAVIASVFNTAVNQQIILPLASNAPVAIASMMILRFLLALCSTTDAFIAASFVTFSHGAKLAFLVFGPLFDFKLVFLYSAVFRRKLVLWFGVVMFIVVGLICWRISDALSERAFPVMKAIR